jgi:hypothetical protein
MMYLYEWLSSGPWLGSLETVTNLMAAYISEHVLACGATTNFSTRPLPQVTITQQHLEEVAFRGPKIRHANEFL